MLVKVNILESVLHHKPNAQNALLNMPTAVVNGISIFPLYPVFLFYAIVNRNIVGYKIL